MADARAVVQDLVDALNNHDIPHHRKLLAGGSKCVTATGHVLDGDGLTELVARTLRAFPDMKITVTRWIVDGDTVVTEETLEGTHQGEWAGLSATGRPLRIPMVHVNRVVDGRIVERVAYHDSAAIVRQLRGSRI